jgi:hypothetical protein
MICSATALHLKRDAFRFLDALVVQGDERLLNLRRRFEDCGGGKL